MRIAAAKALGWTNSMLFPGGRTGELNGAYMCRIIRQARIQSPGMPPFFSPALVWNTCLTQSPNTIFLLTDYRLYSCSVNSARRTQLPLCPPPPHSFLFCPWKRKGTGPGRGGGRWADWRRRKETVVCKDFSLGSLLWMQVQSFSGLFFGSLLFVFWGGDKG